MTVYRVIEITVGHRTIDEPDTLGFWCRYALAREQVMLGAGMTYQLRPDDRTAVARHQSHADMWIGEGRRLRRDDVVAKKCE